MTQAIQCLTYVTENAVCVAVVIQCFMNKLIGLQMALLVDTSSRTPYCSEVNILHIALIFNIL